MSKRILKHRKSILGNAQVSVFLCVLHDLCGSAVNRLEEPSPQIRRARNERAENSRLGHYLIFILSISVFVLVLSHCQTDLFEPAVVNAQGPEVDYSKFLHNSQKHASLACNACHERVDNSATPRFPGHKACTSCHIGQFTTPAIPMCMICHTDTSGNRPPLRNFTVAFKERFNVKFDHSQHMAAGVRPQNGCNACHSSLINRGVGVSIPANLAAHTGCYSCHTPTSKSAGGRDLASCGVCHSQAAYRPTPTTASSFRFSFSHADHGTRQRLGCADCHNLTGGLPQSKQVSSPSNAEHFPTSRGMSCSTCHNGKRTFGGDLNFNDCKRCHSGSTFKMPM